MVELLVETLWRLIRDMHNAASAATRTTAHEELQNIFILQFFIRAPQWPPKLARAGGPEPGGVPNGKSLQKWPVYDGSSRTAMVFGNIPSGTQAPTEAQLAFFQAYFEKLYAK